MTQKELYYLNELSDYKVASDQPDIRGWKIKDKDGRTVGNVEDFLVHKRSERVVYVDVEVDPELIDTGRDPFQNDGSAAGVKEYIDKQGDNHIIIPVGMIDIDREHKLVRTDAIDHTTFRNTRRFSKATGFDRDYERSVYNSYVPNNDLGDAADDTLYERREFRRRDERAEGDPPLKY